MKDAKDFQKSTQSHTGHGMHPQTPMPALHCQCSNIELQCSSSSISRQFLYAGTMLHLHHDTLPPQPPLTELRHV